MPAQLIVTAENALIEELKTVIEGFIAEKDANIQSVMIETRTKEPLVFDDVRQLKGILDPYYPKSLTDKDIEDGIHQGMMDRAIEIPNTPTQ